MELGEWLYLLGATRDNKLFILHIKLPHATEKGIRLLPYGLFVAPACFTYFDSDEDRT